jgi:hypothetical protein
VALWVPIDAAIDEAEMLVATLRDLEAPHIRALDLIAALGQPDEPNGVPQSDRLPWVSVRHDVTCSLTTSDA